VLVAQPRHRLHPHAARGIEHHVYLVPQNMPVNVNGFGKGTMRLLQHYVTTARQTRESNIMGFHRGHATHQILELMPGMFVLALAFWLLHLDP
jgi:hypothetical protein